MISSLDRKLIRDLMGMKGQMLAICLVIGCGVATFIMSLSCLDSLDTTRATYYERYRFADVFANLKRATNSLQGRMEEIPGVAHVHTRVVQDVTLDVEGLNEPAVGRLISVPDREQSTLNSLHLRSGRWIEPGRRGEVMANETFVLAHNLKPGDRIRAILNGRLEELTIVGVVLSPEYVLQIRPGDFLPDPRRFGVFWMAYTQLAPAFNMDGAFNEVSLTLMPGANQAQVLEQLDRLTEPYGGTGAYGREDQLSNRFLSDEISQLRATGVIAPSIFLSVAAFLLNVVVSRIITTQREQIAALKAFGYTHWEVGLHYLKMVLGIVIVGVLLGTAMGAWFGHSMTQMYSRFYKFPVFYYQLHIGIILLAAAISSGAALIGTFAAVLRAIRLPPAEAMRPEPPASYRPTIVERIGLQRLFAQPTRMILRHLERRPFQAILSIFGIALAVAVLILGSFTEDSVNYLMEFQFQISQRQDVTVTFVEPASSRALHEIEHLPGVVAAEPFRSVPTRMRFGHHSRRLGIMGLPARPRLNRILTQDMQPLELPPQGLALSAKLAELLDVKLGEFVTVEVLEGQRPVIQVPVTALIDDFAGTNAYMNIHSLQQLMGEGDTLSGAFLEVDSRHSTQLYRDLKQTPRVAGVNVQEAVLTNFKDTVAENMMVMRTFNLIFACIIATGVVYNTARISLAERSRELATLRVIGFSRLEISAILLGELAVLTLAAIPVGLVIGYLFAALAVRFFATDLFRIPLIINPSTYGFAATVVLIAALVSGLIVRRQLDHLDLVAVLKSKE